MKFPVFEKIYDLNCEFSGYLAGRLQVLTDMWLIPAPKANPAMTGMFHARDREHASEKLPLTDKVSGDILPWSGEFAGKHLISSQLIYRMTGNAGLKETIDKLIGELISARGEDGYLGPFPKDRRLTGPLVWDVWGHYHIIQALLLYHEDTASQVALDTASRAADLICDTFMENDIPMTNDDSHGEMNYAIIHAMTGLFRRTGNDRYLDMARWIVRMWGKTGGPEYMKYALDGLPDWTMR